MMVIFCDMTGGSCGTWSLSPISSCRVWVPGGSSMHRLGLAGAEVEVVAVVRDRLVQRRQVGVDQQVVVAGIGLVHACRRHAHVAQPEPHLEALGYHLAVVRPADIGIGVRGRGRVAGRPPGAASTDPRSRASGESGHGSLPGVALASAAVGGAALSRPTVIVICRRHDRGSCGIVLGVAEQHLQRILPGGSSIRRASVWPPPKWRWFLSLGIGSSSGGRSVLISR